MSTHDLVNHKKINHIIKEYLLNIFSKVNFNKQNERSYKLKINLSASFVLRILDALMGLILVPILLNVLGQNIYGIWLIIYSVTGYLLFLDLGTGLGFRNRFSEAIATNNYDLANSYSSTTYYFTLFLSFLLVIIFLPVVNNINWTHFLNIEEKYSTEVRNSISLVIIFYSLRLLSGIYINIIMSLQLTAIIDLFSVVAKFLSFVAVIIYTKLFSISLELLTIILFGFPVILIFICSFIFLRIKFAHLKIINQGFSKRLFPNIFNLSANYFIIQIAVVVLFATDNVIIAKLFDPGRVTEYQIAAKYFGLPIAVFSLLLGPLWPAISDAYFTKEYQWIKARIKNYLSLWLIFSFGIIVMFFMANIIYVFWVGKKITIQNNISLGWMFYGILVMISGIFATFLNGVGKLRVALYGAVFQMMINIPLSIYLAKNLELGPAGVILATDICMLSAVILQPIQYYKIINKKAVGIWDK